MKWYSISYTLDEKIAGVDWQVKELHNSAAVFGSESKDVFYNEPVKSKAAFDYAELKGKAKMTDILWSAPSQFKGYLISDKLLSIFKNYNLTDYQTKPALVKKGAKTYNYNWFRMFGDFVDFVDFEKSVFEFNSAKGDIKEIVSFKNPKEYTEAMKKASITFEKIKNLEIHFNKDFLSKKYDMLFLGQLNPIHYIINESIKRQIESESLIGIRFDLIPYLGW